VLFSGMGLGCEGRSVKPSALPALVRTHLLPSAKHQLRDATASLILFSDIQPDAAVSRLVVGYTWDGCDPIRRVSARSAALMSEGCGFAGGHQATSSAASMRLFATVLAPALGLRLGSPAEGAPTYDRRAAYHTNSVFTRTMLRGGAFLDDRFSAPGWRV
jgi:hypothetical protein